jgi:hypothetical protein
MKIVAALLEGDEQLRQDRERCATEMKALNRQAEGYTFSQGVQPNV